LAEKLAIHGGEPVRARPWPPWPEFGEAEREALRRVLESRNWGGHPSPNVEARALCREFAAYVGSTHAVPTLNGTISLTLALQAARISPGAEVITTAYTFVGTASAVVEAGCVPVFVDVLPETYCVDPDQVEAALSPRTEAILPVHLACSMADLDRLGELARRRGLLLVEDCAHAHGARWRGRGAGSIGDFGSFSMQTTKLMTAGEGGLITTSNGTYEQRLQSLVNCGRKESGYDRFPERMLGTNARMTEWQAAVLREQLRRLPGQHERRAARIERFEKEIAAVPGLRPLARDERVTERTAYQFILRYDSALFSGVPRDDALLALIAEGVPCYGRFYVPIPEDPLFAMDPKTNPVARSGVDYSGRAFPVASRAAYRESIWLSHSLFLGEEEDVDDLVAAFAKVKARAAALREKPPLERPARPEFAQ
jgi:dTDP-4-amino-4,6-dideoxygalactose transaminase